MKQFDREVLYEEAEEINVREIRARIEACVLQMIRDLQKKDSHTFTMIDRTEGNVLEEDITSLIRLGSNTKKRKMTNQRSLVSYSRTWKLMEVVSKLLQSGKHMTQREIFYLLIYCFDNQNQLNEIILDVVSLLQVPRELIGIYSSSRGYIAGKISWDAGNGAIDLTNMGVPGMSIPGYFPHNLCINAKPKCVNYIIVIEKEGVFQRLLEDKFHHKIPCVLVTAKGFPDLSTRMVVHYLKRKFRVPVLGLVDYDPHGILILMTYKIGSIRFGLEGFKYAIPDMKWLGVHKKDVESLNLLRTRFNDRDKTIKKRLLRMKYIKEDPLYLKQVKDMDCKVEIQTINNISFDFMSTNYLTNKILRKEFF